MAAHKKNQKKLKLFLKKIKDETIIVPKNNNNIKNNNKK